MDIAGDFFVLLDEPFLGVDHKKRNVRTVDGAQSAHDAVALGGHVDLATLAHAGGIDDDEFLAVVGEGGIDGVAGGAGDVGHNGAFFADDGVCEGALADVWSADDGDVHAIVFFVDGFRDLFEACVDSVQKIAGVGAVGG